MWLLMYKSFFGNIYFRFVISVMLAPNKRNSVSFPLYFLNKNCALVLFLFLKWLINLTTKTIRAWN